MLTVSLEEIAQKSELVVEGKVIKVETGIAETPRKIHTYVTMEVIEKIKGNFDGNTVTLSFLGGTVGDTTLRVGGMRIPTVGEHGIYFVESTERDQVHPLLGWSQGHFLVEKDATGIERVLTNRRKQIVEIRKQIAAPRGLSDGVAKGIIVQKKAMSSDALSVEEFKEFVKGMLGPVQ